MCVCVYVLVCLWWRQFDPTWSWHWPWAASHDQLGLVARVRTTVHPVISKLGHVAALAEPCSSRSSAITQSENNRGRKRTEAILTRFVLQYSATFPLPVFLFITLHPEREQHKQGSYQGNQKCHFHWRKAINSESLRSSFSLVATTFSELLRAYLFWVIRIIFACFLFK